MPLVRVLRYTALTTMTGKPDPKQEAERRAREDERQRLNEDLIRDLHIRTGKGRTRDIAV